MNIDIKLPTSWAQLSQSQLRSVYKYLSSSSLSAHQCKLLLALKFSGIKYVGMFNGISYAKKDKLTFELDSQHFLALAHALDFITSIPPYPVRLFEIAHRKAIHPLLRELSFARWLGIENLYCGFLTTKNPQLLNEILSLLYPAEGLAGKLFKPFKNVKFIDWRHINALNWISSFKIWLTDRYPEIYPKPNPEIQNVPAITQKALLDNMNAQIRALTKGDITKKEAVLAMDVHSALTELNAIALEARRLNEMKK